MIKRIKDKSKCLAQWTLKVGRRHYFHVFLWDSQESFDQNTLDNEPGQVLGCVNYCPYTIEIEKKREKKIIMPKLGEIHFIKDIWTLEIVAHELCHALLHRLDYLEPSIDEIFSEEGNSEESICLEFGQWMDEIYRHLWQKNPYGKHSGVRQ
jgi:hypothetical protein